MALRAVVVLLSASLLHWCQVPTVPTLAVKAPVGGKNSRPSKVRIIPRMYDFHHCKDKTHSLIVKNSSNHLEKDGTEYVDVDYELTATARRLTAFQYILHRCPIGVAGKCEYYSTRSWNMPVCKLITSSGMVWSPMIHNIYPAFKCPLLKGSYVGRNMTADLTSYGIVIEGLELDKYSWPFEVHMHSDSGLYICLNLIGEVRRVRVKEN